MDIKFKDYFISKPCCLTSKGPGPWEFDVCKMNSDGKTHFVIACFYYNFKEPCWEFSSIGTRYLEYYSEGLNDWLLKVMDMFECNIHAEEDNV